MHDYINLLRPDYGEHSGANLKWIRESVDSEGNQERSVLAQILERFSVVFVGGFFLQKKDNYLFTKFHLPRPSTTNG
jgi:hypothetical protein